MQHLADGKIAMLRKLSTVLLVTLLANFGFAGLASAAPSGQYPTPGTVSVVISGGGVVIDANGNVVVDANGNILVNGSVTVDANGETVFSGTFTFSGTGFLAERSSISSSPGRPVSSTAPVCRS